MNKKLNNINLHRFIYVLKLIYEKGDADNPISSTEIIEILNTEKNIDICQRTIDTIVKSFNEAIENDFEISILNSKPKKYYFHSTPSLEFGEAKAIIDLVYSSKFFTERIKNNFIDRMQEQFNNSKKIMLEKRINSHISGNENDNSFFSSFEQISIAIYNQNSISFYYSKKLPNNTRPRIKQYRNIYPIETTCNNNTFYVYCFDPSEKEESRQIKHFRIDFISKVKQGDQVSISDNMLEKTTKQIIDSTYGYGPQNYADLELTFDENCYPNIIDKFGNNLLGIRKVDNNLYAVNINNCPISNTFYAWIVGFGGKIKITNPEIQVEKFKTFLNSIF